MKKKKIVFYIGSLTKGGAERVVTNLAEYFYEKGYEVFVLTKLRAATEYSLSEGIHRMIADITKEEEKGRVQNLFLRIAKLRRLIKEINPAVVVSFIGKNNLMSVVATRGTGIPVAVSVRSNPAREIGGGWKRKLTFLIFNMAEGVILQTNEAREFFPNIIRKKAVILPNSLNPDFIRTPYDGERRKEIVTVGRIDENKNQKMMIEAFAPLAPKYMDWQMIFYGDGPMRFDLERRVCELGLEEQIIFKGIKENIPERIEGASVFVLPSKQEGMPNALIEAMVLGLAVVSTDCPCGGPRDLIIPEENGILVPVDDVEALSEMLERLMKDEGLRKKFSVEAMKIKERVLPENVNQQWEEYLTEISKRRN